MNGKYDDIINLSRPDSGRHPKMSMHDRAAQFAPFAALTGHKEAIEETGRTTEKKIILDENEKAELDYNLNYLLQSDKEREISVTYFEKDPFKDGGAYITETGFLKKADAEKHCIIFKNGKTIDVRDIYDITII